MAKMGLSYNTVRVETTDSLFVAKAELVSLQVKEPTVLVSEEPKCLKTKGQDIDPQEPAFDPRELIVALYDEFRPRLYRYLQSMQIGTDQTEEVIQETFLRLTAQLRKHGDMENVRGWIVRVAHNLASDIHKKNNRRWKHAAEEERVLASDRMDPALGPEDTYLEKEQLQRMEEALETFNPKHRQSFLMRAEGFLYKDIGAALGVNEQRAVQMVKKVSVRLAAICERKP
jgi:RNA polymerase sigma-70 factor (ECF subfamily)